MRVHNFALKSKSFRCTVCSRLNGTSAPANKEEPKADEPAKGKKNGKKK